MDEISYAEAFVGLLIASMLTWVPVFAFAYARRQFGGSARNYCLACAATCCVTVAFFILLSAWESRGGS